MTRVLVFDSGVGGLTVHREIERLMPQLDLVYLADDRHFPYGGWQEQPLLAHILETLGQAIATHRPDCVVIACNTASTLVLAPLRARFDIPFVGTVPAIKSASEATRSGLVSVLATPATVKRDYTRDLIERFAGTVSVTLVGAPGLAALAECKLRGEPVDAETLHRETAPCFVETPSGRTDHVVLACTHFPLLVEEFEGMAPWPVNWIDPAPAIARRVRDVLGQAPEGGPPGRRLFLNTSASPWEIGRLVREIG